MRQSQLFTKTRKEAPRDEVSKNAILLTRAGFIHKELAGVYSLLPLGFRVVKKIENIIREEMDAIGGEEMKTSILQNKDVWEKTNRWDDDAVDSWFKTKLKNGTELGLSFTNEEAYANLMKQHVSSYKDLPAYPYDFKDIFRNEVRSKSGILRGREFYWKALYSFSKDEKEHAEFYEKAKGAYEKIFDRVGIGELTYLTFASGGTFSKFSHEFQTLTKVGEDTIFLSRKNNLAINKEVYTEEILKDLNLDKSELVEEKAIEVGNIFTLGTRFSEPLGLAFIDEKGNKQPVFMGSYGIGLGRLMGTVVEVLADEKGLVWPASITPMRVHLLTLGMEPKTKELAEEICKTLETEDIDVLYDDRNLRAGEKFADADLIGIPTRIILGEKTLSDKTLEVKDRATGETKEMTLTHLIEELKK
ncbi:MAG: aminoacyl--tRNA ligase-related protein [Patescibacteria group bacterium]